MNSFHANGLFDLLKTPELREDIKERLDELLLARREELAKADEWGQKQITDDVKRQVKREFSLHYSLF